MKKSNSQKRCFKCREELRKEHNKKNQAYGITAKEIAELKKVEPEGSAYVISKLYKPYGAEFMVGY